MILKKIFDGYKEIFSSAAKIFLLLLFCAASGALFVFPLWYFASNLPETYTLCMLVLAASIFIFLSVKKIRKNGIRNTIIFLLKFLIIALTVSAFIYLVLSGRRFFTIPLLLLSFFVWGLVSFILKQHGSPLREEILSEE